MGRVLSKSAWIENILLADIGQQIPPLESSVAEL